MNKPMNAALAAMVAVCLLAGVNLTQAQSVPPPWASADLGSPTLAGSASFSSGTFQIDAAGEDIWGSQDQFHFVYQAVSGDVDFRARVDSVTRADGWSKAGVMIRGSLSADAAHGYAVISASKGTAFQRRRSAGGLSTHTAGPFSQAPGWVRLVRAGTTLTAYTSPDGSRWTEIGSDTIALGATAYLGLAVTSHNGGARTSASFSEVGVTSSALPAGQSAADVGAPAIHGRTAYSGGRYTIDAGGADIWGSSDQFHFVYQAVSGDVDIVARVASLRKAAPSSKAGVMIRESLAPDSRHAMAVTTPKKGYAFQRRTDTGAWSEHTSGGRGTAPGWLRLVRKGMSFEAFRSADGTNWTSMGTASIAMSDSVYVGLAVTSHNVSVPTTAVIDSVTVNAAAAPSNSMPSVVLTSPADGSAFTEPATLRVTANANDRDGSVASVEFYANSTLIGRDMSAPYEASAGSLLQGDYRITAVATDNMGASTVSSAADVTVSAGTSPPPPVTAAPTGIAFTASADHATLVTKYVLEVFVSGSTPGSTPPVDTSDLGKPAPDANGDITVDLTSFFQALAPGSYSATVSARGSGGSSRSQAVSFTR